MGDALRDLEAESRTRERTRKALPVSVLLPVKPLSVNEAWQGRRYKTRAYKKYEAILLAAMPDITIPQPPYTMSYLFGFSSPNADIDNPIKLLQDIIQKRYGIDDKHIYKLIAEKVRTKKGDEFLGYQIETFALEKKVEAGEKRSGKQCTC